MGITNYGASEITSPAVRERIRIKKYAYTPKQGQYLSFIHYYRKINGIPPAQTDFQKHFKVTPPTVHMMLVKLEERGYIRRESGVPRSIELLLPEKDIPDLE
nr:MAG: repressor LexA [Candidatus Kentron sp. DK]